MEYSRDRIASLQNKLDQFEHALALSLDMLDRSQGKDHDDSLTKYLELTEQATSARKELAQANQEYLALESEYAKAQEILSALQSTHEERFEPGDE